MMKEWWGAGSRFRGSRQKYETWKCSAGTWSLTWRWNTKTYIRGCSTQRRGDRGHVTRGGTTSRSADARHRIKPLFSTPTNINCNYYGPFQPLWRCFEGGHNKYVVDNRSCKMFEKKWYSAFEAETQFLNILSNEFYKDRLLRHDQEHALTHNDSAEKRW